MQQSLPNNEMLTTFWLLIVDRNLPNLNFETAHNADVSALLLQNEPL